MTTMLAPARTLFVANAGVGAPPAAQAWGVNNPTSPFFTKIGDALAEAMNPMAMNPVPSRLNPVAIVIFPGT